MARVQFNYAGNITKDNKEYIRTIPKLILTDKYNNDTEFKFCWDQVNFEVNSCEWIIGRI